MPKYYCDYCDIYLTHDSLAVRRAHNSGWKHQAQVKAHYAEFAKNYAQFAIDQMTRPQGPPMPMFAPQQGQFRPPPFMQGPPPQQHQQQFMPPQQQFMPGPPRQAT